MKSALYLVGAMVLLPVFVHADPIVPTAKSGSSIVLDALPARIRVEFDPIPVSEQETMGALGFHYDLFPFSGDKTRFVGVGGFGGLTGDRGGFFTGGLTVGYRIRLGRWACEANTFAGAGGGAGAFPGSGLMLRTQLLLEHDFEPLRFRLGLAHTDFPKTTNEFGHDTHLSFGLGLPILFRTVSAEQETSPRVPPRTYTGEFRREAITPVMAIQRPLSSSRGRDGRPLAASMPLLGIQFRRALTGAFYWSLTGYGAGGAGFDGFAEALAGIGFARRFGRKALAWHACLQAGMAGGGTVATGGGLLLQPVVGLDISLGRNWSVRPAAGWAAAPGGRFQALDLEVGVSRSWRTPHLRPGAGGEAWPGDRFDPKPWRLSIRNKVYLPAPSAHLKSGRSYDSTLQQMGLALSTPLSEHLSLEGAAFGAWAGNVGAYGEGLFGICLVPTTHGAQIRYEIGVGGGGGMDVGDGLIHQLSAGWTWALNETSALSFECGRMQGLRGGSFAATVLQMGYTRRLWFIGDKSQSS